MVLEAFLLPWPSATSLQLLASILRPPYPIHPSAWKVNSEKLAYGILHRSTPECPSGQAIRLQNATGRNSEAIYPITYDARRGEEATGLRSRSHTE